MQITKFTLTFDMRRLRRTLENLAFWECGPTFEPNGQCRPIFLLLSLDFMFRGTQCLKILSGRVVAEDARGPYLSHGLY